MVPVYALCGCHDVYRVVACRRHMNFRAIAGGWIDVHVRGWSARAGWRRILFRSCRLAAAVFFLPLVVVVVALVATGPVCS